MKICVSGHFDPLHSGHLAMFEQAAELGELTVIVNNEKQTLAKKGFYFMPIEERVNLISKLACVDEVVVAVDDDSTVCKTLEQVKPQIFANGGDRKKGNIPELDVCKRLGIEAIWGLDAEHAKDTHSSKIIKTGVEQYMNSLCETRPWGRFNTIAVGNGYKVKRLVVDPGKSLSLQRHKHRAEHWVVVSGRAEVTLDELNFGVMENESCFIPTQTWHRLENLTEVPLVVIEVATGNLIEESDIERK